MLINNVVDSLYNNSLNTELYTALRLYRDRSQFSFDRVIVNENVSKIRVACGDLAKSVRKFVNNLDLIHRNDDHLLAILVINR